MPKKIAPFRAAVVQTLATLGDLDENIRLIEANTLEAVRQGARLVVFPECMNTGYLFDSAEHCRRLAEPIDGRYVEAMAGLCKKHHLHMASGFTELAPDKKTVFNSGLLLDPSGDIALHYHKQFLATHDQNWFTCGERGCPVVDTELGRLALLICFDGRIPEIARTLALQGAEVVLDMANFFAMDQADMWVPARAYENGYWIVAATKCGVERSIHYPGGSMIVDPDGMVVAGVPAGRHGVASAPVDPGTARRKAWPAGGDRFADRRPDTYSLMGAPFDATPLAKHLWEPLVPELTTTKAAAVQAHAGAGPDDLDKALDMADHAAKLGAKVLALPQFFPLPAWLPGKDELACSGPANDKALQRCTDIAANYEIFVILPLVTPKGDRFVQEAVVIGPTGELGRQRQVHPEPELADILDPGKEFQVFDTPAGRLGILLGYDGMFPESSRVLALAGADVILWCSAWRHVNDRRLLAVPKAEDNRVFLICANRTDCPNPGGSLIVPPTGFPHWDLDRVVPAETRSGAVMPGFMNLALARQKAIIPKVDVIRNRLVETYGPITKTARKV